MPIISHVPEAAQSHTSTQATPTISDDSVLPTTKPIAKRKYTRNSQVARKVCLKSDNPSLNMERAELGKPESSKTRIKILCTDGTYKKDKWKHRKEEKWDDKKWISELNKWRTLKFSSAFKNDKSITKLAKARWSHAELQFLEGQIRKKVTDTGAYLSGKDFREFAQIHNKRFEGKEIKIGEKLANGQAATSNQIISARSPQALKSLHEKNPEFKKVVETLIKQYNTDTGDEDSSDEEMGESEENEDEMDDEDNGLEEDSDDEMDGYRPAAQPMGGVLVPAK